MVFAWFLAKKKKKKNHFQLVTGKAHIHLTHRVSSQIGLVMLIGIFWKLAILPTFFFF